MTFNLNWREKAALEHLACGFVELLASFPRGVGEKTLIDLLAWKLVERATCPTYGTIGYRITERGESALWGKP